jgi:predicted short-subunit dehydrogenase-like oxidoreductase (DUF2520 family)
MRELERDKSHADPIAEHSGQVPLVLIGRGRVGRSLDRLAEQAGLDHRLVSFDEALPACGEAEIALLCVPDDAIEDACATLAQAIPPLRFVGHTSGATGLDALSAATEAGASAFSLHPLQTFPDQGASPVGAPCAIAASDPDALDTVAALASALSMSPFEVTEENRAAYHAAASMASNFLVALEESASTLLARAGVEDARQLLAPLVLRTAANWAERGEAALTGPIARGDERTVERHAEALAVLAPELLDAYEALAARTRAIASDPTPGARG